MTIRALHSVDVWLPRTQGWIYDQVRYLPEQVETYVACDATRNLDRFPHPRLTSLEDRTLVPRLADRAARALRFRRHPAYLRREILRVEPDVVHSHFGHVGWRNLGAVGDAAHHVVTFYGLDLSRLPTVKRRWRDRYRKLFKRGDLFLFEGPHMAATAEELGCPSYKIAVHRLGVDLDRIDFVPRQWTPEEPLRVLIAASFREKKGIPYALEALGRLRREVPLEVTVIGDANRQPGSRREKRKILDRVARSGLESAVKFLGFQPHDVFLDVAYRHHLFLSPSVTAADGDTEGGAPISLIEVAASGMPIVSTRHCDIPEVVLDGVNAELAEERDVDGLMDAIRTLLDAHEDWLDRLRHGRAHVEARFDARSQGRELGRLYRDVLRR
jgi:colanic acid/amylovoran biosynthesis glycosyltransferase